MARSGAARLGGTGNGKPRLHTLRIRKCAQKWGIAGKGKLRNGGDGRGMAVRAEERPGEARMGKVRYGEVMRGFTHCPHCKAWTKVRSGLVGCGMVRLGDVRRGKPIADWKLSAKVCLEWLGVAPKGSAMSGSVRRCQTWNGQVWRGKARIGDATTCPVKFRAKCYEN